MSVFWAQYSSSKARITTISLSDFSKRANKKITCECGNFNLKKATVSSEKMQTKFWFF